MEIYCQAQEDGTRGQDRKLSMPCTLCRDSTRKGLLPLGNGDFVVCPDCGGTGTFVMWETPVTPKRHFAVRRF